MNPRKIVKKLIPTSLFQSIEPMGHLAEAVFHNVTHGFPARNLKVIGVTGTDGKTTTCMLIAQMLRESGLKVAVLTTVSVDYGDGRGPQPSPNHMTTASAGSLVTMLKKIAQHQPDWVVLETSSHALAQHRAWGVPYSVAVMTNVTHEHLDYHKTFERYVAAKTMLFKQCNKNKKGLRTGVVNADDPSADKFMAQINNPVTYGLQSGELQAKDIVSKPAGNTFTATIGDDSYQISSALTGQFNVYNVLATIAVGRAVGLTKHQIEQGIASLPQVPGRMMPVKTGKSFSVYIDYAVTPSALESVLMAAKQIATGKVAIVFGATGDRDQSKRSVMGETVAKLADRIYLTDDETHTEDPTAIRKAVLAGIESAGATAKTHEFDDRGEAIKRAVKDAKAGDVILLTGIGHQTTRNMGGKDEPWSDEQAVITSLPQ
jgi:UDP-N-acetylmuramoyl-L-alanyl-D-glutamate--2,6-diaminopimelate ligase